MSRYLRTLSTLGALILGAYCAMIIGCSPGKSDPSPELKAFADDFRAANQAETIRPMLELYALKGTDERTLALLKGALGYELGLPIQSIHFEALTGAPEETIDFHHNDVHYGPTIPPRMRMRVNYSVEDGFSSLYTIGTDEAGDWKIVCAEPKPNIDF